MGFINFIIDNWAAIGAVIAFIAGGIISIRKFFLQPSEKQIEQILQWLLWAVTEAEKMLGGGTGELKLSKVYEKFVSVFPWLSRIVPVDLFNDLVDESLETMRTMLKSNPNAATVVGEGERE